MDMIWIIQFNVWLVSEEHTLDSSLLSLFSISERIYKQLHKRGMVSSQYFETHIEKHLMRLFSMTILVRDY